MSVYPDNINQMLKAANENYDFMNEKLAKKIIKNFLPYIKKMHLDKGKILLHLGDVPNKLVFVK